MFQKNRVNPEREEEEEEEEEEWRTILERFQQIFVVEKAYPKIRCSFGVSVR
jgi:hypothetical protein